MYTHWCIIEPPIPLSLKLCIIQPIYQNLIIFLLIFNNIITNIIPNSLPSFQMSSLHWKIYLNELIFIFLVKPPPQVTNPLLSSILSSNIYLHWFFTIIAENYIIFHLEVGVSLLPNLLLRNTHNTILNIDNFLKMTYYYHIFQLIQLNNTNEQSTINLRFIYGGCRYYITPLLHYPLQLISLQGKKYSSIFITIFEQNKKTSPKHSQNIPHHLLPYNYDHCLLYIVLHI